MKHFSEDDILRLKKQEQGGGCLSNLLSTLAVMGLIIIVITAAISYAASQQPGMAVASQATAIYGPTELVLVNTPTLRPTVTPFVVATAVPATPPAPVLEVAATAVPVALPTIAPTYTPLPTYTTVPTQTPAPTYTPPPTWTPAATWTPAPSPTPLPAVSFDNSLNAYSLTRANLTRLTWLVAALIGLSSVALFFSLRPSDRDLKRLQRLIEMNLMNALKPPAPVRALPAPAPAPVRTIPLAEYQRTRVAPVQTPVTPVTPVQNTGAAPPETITVSVQPVGEGEDDIQTMQAIFGLWNDMAGRGERPSFNRVCIEYFGSKNSDRLAIVRRAVRWGRERGDIVAVVEATAANGDVS